MDQITNNEYLNSIRPIAFITALFGGEWKTLAELSSPGKSGSFLYFTFDGRFLIKAILKKEFLLLKRSILDYFLYLNENSTSSLISRYYGLHKLELRIGSKKPKTYYLVVMNNIFDSSLDLHYRFDLKGSTYGRHEYFRDGKNQINEPTPTFQ